MCGFAVKSNFSAKRDMNRFIKSVRTLSHRGPNEEGFLFLQNYYLGHKRLSIIDLKNGHQPMSNINSYLCYNGELYNKGRILELLKEKECVPKTTSDTEYLLLLLDLYGIDIVNEINGIFSFAYIKDDILFIARDHVGVKPLYYTFIDGDIMVASEIKALLPYMDKVIVNREGICELFGMGPSSSLGKTIYKGIYQLKPGNYATFDKNGFKEVEYFKFEAFRQEEEFEDAKNHLKGVLDNAIHSQMTSDVGVSTLLSGGLDSTIITMIASKHSKDIDTYSIDYEDNNTDFKANSFETSNDQDYIKYVTDMARLDNEHILVSNRKLMKLLKDVVYYRDGPGMTTIDASMYYLAKAIARKNKVALSGECSDEILGGYPWYYKNEQYDSFPWIRSVDLKQSLLSEKLQDIDLDRYVKEEYNKALSNVSLLEEDDGNNAKRIMYYLNVKYFMPTLLARADQMSMAASLELRVPFADKDLISYLYNMDFSYKYKDETEKYILREAYKDEIPASVYNRKKSPYPKSQSKKLEKMIKNKYYSAIADKNSILHQLLDIDGVEKLIHSENIEVPWFGQLLRKTELLAYFYQIHVWGKAYNVELEL